MRRHTRWLYSIDADGLQGDGITGVAVTLTLLECPATAEDWEAARRAFWRRVERLGLVRGHWVVEWQKRGVPHLHTALYFDSSRAAWQVSGLVIVAWLQVMAKYGAGVGGQFWNEIDGPLGWLQYLSKHAARGVAHYQRQGKPAGWESTGRLWGHTGDWPEIEPWTVDASWPAYHRLRRIVRSWRVADARQQLLEAKTPAEARSARRRITFARRMLSSSDPALSRVRGISEWIPLEQLERIVQQLHLEGFEISTRRGIASEAA